MPPPLGYTNPVALNSYILNGIAFAQCMHVQTPIAFKSYVDKT